MRFANPKNDVAFKKIFGDRNKPEILMSFMNAVMGLSGEQRITSIEIMSPLQAPQIEGLKMTTLDVRARDASGKSFIVEMQANAEDAFEKRSLFYTSQAYVSQLEKGSKYAELQPVYFIGILDFNLFNGSDYLTRHLLLNSQTYEQCLKDFELYFIELKKFTKGLDELESTLEKWIYFMRHAEDFNEAPDALRSDREIAQAFEQAARYKWTRDELDAYQYWEFERLKFLSVEEELVTAMQENSRLQGEMKRQQAEMERQQVEMERQQGELKRQQAEIERQQQVTLSAIRALAASGMATEAIAEALNITPEQVVSVLRTS
jgi:predicted transposase/invertase (TIGR01784 family)